MRYQLLTRGRPSRCPDAGVDSDAAVRKGQHRVRVELGNSRVILADPRQAADEIDKRGHVGRRRTPEALDKLPGLAGRDQLLSIDIGHRGDPEADVADQLGEDAARAEGDEGPLTVSGGYCANQRPTLDPVGIEVGRDQPSVDCRMTVKSAIETLVGELGEEADESIDVACRRGAQAQGAAVAQDDVDTFTVDWSALRLLQGRDHQPADLS